MATQATALTLTVGPTGLRRLANLAAILGEHNERARRKREAERAARWKEWLEIRKRYTAADLAWEEWAQGTRPDFIGIEAAARRLRMRVQDLEVMVKRVLIDFGISHTGERLAIIPVREAVRLAKLKLQGRQWQPDSRTSAVVKSKLRRAA